jgi:uncharacterized protein DUF4345
MKFISYTFFYTYIGLVIFAGFGGAFISTALDFKFLFNVDIHTLPDAYRVNLLSQYRFLRGIEFGYGVFAIVFRKEIFTIKKYNSVYLVIMGSGILGRVFSILFDGSPNGKLYFFLIYELVAFIFIIIYTRNNINGTAVSTTAS